MPKIRQIQRQSTGGVNVALGDQTDTILKVESGQAQGQHILGQSLAKLGQAVADFGERKEALNRDLLDRQARTDARRAASRAQTAALKSGDKKPDGSNLMELFSESYADQQIEFLDGLSKEQSARVKVIWDEISVSNEEKLSGLEREEFYKFRVRENDKLFDRLSITLAESPTEENFAIANAEVLGTLNADLKNGFIMPDQHKKMLDSAIQNNAISSINAMMREGKYKEAEERVKKGDMKHVFATKTAKDGSLIDEKTRVLDRIKQREVIHKDSILKEMNLSERQERKDKEEQGERAFAGLITMIEDGASSQSIRSKALTLRKDVISSAEYGFIDSVLNKTQGSKDDALVFKYTDDIIEGERSLQDIKASIYSDVEAKDLSANKGINLLKMMKQRQISSKSATTRLRDERYKLAKQMLDSVIGSRSMFDKLPGKFAKKQALRTRAGIILHDKMMENPSADPTKLSIESIDDLGGIEHFIKLSRLPGSIKQDTTDEVEEALVQMEIRFKREQVSKEEYDLFMMRGAQRIKSLELRDTILGIKKSGDK